MGRMDRESHGEFAAFAHLRFELDLAIHALNQDLYDCQA
jgi:hypothetical protein